MLRLTILASAVPMIVAGVFAREQIGTNVNPCITMADAAVQIAPTPWQAQRLVSFTSDPTEATVRVRIVDDASIADFAIADGTEAREADSCVGTGPTRLVGITDQPSAAPTVIYLTRDGDADYRIFVSSKNFTLREAAALIVGAQSERQIVMSKAL